MVEVSTTAGAILAGGKSSRFGSPKELAKIGGDTILDRVLATHRSVFRDVVVVTDAPERLGDRDVPRTGDLFPGAGPLAGIHAALDWADRRGKSGVCCSPCDAPFLHSSLFELLLSAAEGTSAVLPRSDGPLGYEPLFGWYSTRLVPALESFLTAGGRAAHEFIAGLADSRIIEVARIEGCPPPERMFMNVNTPAELELARAWEREGRAS